MVKDDLLISLRTLNEWITKEGPSFSWESFLSSQEVITKAIAPAKPPTPTERHAIATERHIEDACKEHDRIAAELAAVQEFHAAAMKELRRELTLVIDSQRKRLDWFVPHYEGLKRDYDNIRSLNFSSLLMITVGGVLIGSASFLAPDVFKFSTLAAGVTATTYGLWTQWLVVSRSPTSERGPKTGEPGRGPGWSSEFLAAIALVLIPGTP